MKKGTGNSAFFLCGKEEKHDPIHLPTKPHGPGHKDWNEELLSPSLEESMGQMMAL